MYYVSWRRAKAGFTLIELLVVMAIIAILAAILFPVLAKAREKARQTSCLSGEKQLGLAILMYVQDYDGVLPWTCGASRNPGEQLGSGSYMGVSWQGRSDGVELVDLLQPYVQNAQAWFCPDIPLDVQARLAPTPDWTYRRIGTSFQYNLFQYCLMMGMGPGTIFGGQPLDRATDVAIHPMLWDDPCYGVNVLESWLRLPHSEGINAVYGDGHAKWNVVNPNVMWCCAHGGDGWTSQ